MSNQNTTTTQGKTGNITVLFGSQTGTAQDVAEEIARIAYRHHFEVMMSALDDYNVSRFLQDSLIVIVVATTGQGDPPDNMQKFWKFIMRKGLPNGSLSHVKFALAGLGDSSYPKFNFIAKKLQKRFVQLGAEALIEPALGDDQHDLGHYAAVEPWLKQFFETVLKMYTLPKPIIQSDELLPPRYHLCRLEKNPKDNKANLHSNVVKVPLLSNERITHRDHWQDVRLIKFDISKPDLSYSAGDVLVVQPKNLPDTVVRFLKVLNLNPDETVSLESNLPGVQVPFSGVCTFQELAETYFDFNGLPKRYFWELLARFTKSELEKDKLEEFCTAVGQQELFSYCHRPRRTLLEVLEDFPHAANNIPVDYLFDLVGPLQPRMFSIASSLSAHPGEAHLLMAVVNYRTKLHAPRRGVCSTWLASLQPGDMVPVRVKGGTITFPKNDKEVIMVGPGTGMAPFRNFVQERVVQKQSNNWLFFGCRSKEKDFLCKEELEKYETDKALTLTTAFSRDQEYKVYVQHKIEECGEKLVEMLQKGACFYIAGNAKQMPTQVKDAVINALQKHGPMSEEQASDFLNDMERSRRYQTETWS